MKYLVTILTIMAATTFLKAQDGKAQTVKGIFSRETAVQTTIKADPAIIWALLTNAADYPRWNTTVISIEGNIRQGEKIKLKSVLDTKRTFTVKVKEIQPEQRMVWGDSKGNRTYTLTKQGGENVFFEMREKIGGLMFPMYAKYIPPFDTVFEKFAADLKKEAETIQNTKK
jgi:uncharacterized protein YndB with AHSA1/START domain